MSKNYTIIVDEICPEHGGRNFSYQYDDENFERIESACEGCNVVSRQPVSEEVQAARQARSHERPQRPPR